MNWGKVGVTNPFCGSQLQQKFGSRVGPESRVREAHLIVKTRGSQAHTTLAFGVETRCLELKRDHHVLA